MTDITSHRLLWCKGLLFLLLVLLTATLLILETMDMQVAALLSVAVWSFCRFYYFAFYVIQHYVDDQFRFAGLWDFAKYALGTTRGSAESPDAKTEG